jgi:hypothetical protein
MLSRPDAAPHSTQGVFHQAGYHKAGQAKKYKYDDNSALCVCMEGTSQHYGSHGKNHAAIDFLAEKNEPPINAGDEVSIADYNKLCAKAVAAQCGCKAECIQAQLDHSLQPTDRKIQHVDSHSSAAIDDADTPKLTEALLAPPAPPT